MSTAPRTERAGFTLTEMLVSLTLFTIVITAALGAYQRESRMFAHGNDRLSHVQNYGYAVSSLEQDLEQAGAGVVPAQPSIVYAGPDVLAFNADYASNTPGDIGAVYIQPDAPTEEVSALRRSQRMTLPTTTFAYPDVDYEAGGVNSPAELIVFFVQPDGTTDRTDDFALYRQVNGTEPELLARRLLRVGHQPFFSYRELVASDTAADAILPVPDDDLPLSHGAPVHLSPADTGAVGRVDNLRAVRLRFAVLNGRDGDGEKASLVSRLLWLRNMRERPVQMCGDQPLATPKPTVDGVLNGAGDPEVRVTWAPAADDGAGEDDVMGYVLWKRLEGTSDWGDPYVNLPAGQPSYLYVDDAVDEGVSYEYALAAQDCTPSLSDRSPAADVTTPTP